MHNLQGYVRGRVQGVGFRYHLRNAARLNAVNGYAINRADGSVEFLLQGEQAAVERVLDEIRRGPRFSRVDEVVAEPVPDLPARADFVIG